MKKVRRIESAFELARILLALVIAYALSLLCLVLVTEDPIEAVYMFAVGPLTSTRRIGQVMFKFIPYALCGDGHVFYVCQQPFQHVWRGVLFDERLFCDNRCLRFGTLSSAIDCHGPHFAGGGCLFWRVDRLYPRNSRRK